MNDTNCLPGAKSVEDTFRDLGIGRTLGYQEIAAGRLRVCKIGTRSVIFDDDKAAYIALLKSEADARRSSNPKTAA